MIKYMRVVVELYFSIFGDNVTCYVGSVGIVFVTSFISEIKQINVTLVKQTFFIQIFKLTSFFMTARMACVLISVCIVIED